MKKISMLLILTMIISLIPALNVSAADGEYYLKGIYDGATVVIQHEPTKTVTLVDTANAGVVSDTASNVAKVVFTFNNGTSVTDDTAPFSYTMTFTHTGEQTLEYDVYKTGNSTDTPNESKTITFKTVAGVMNAASFSENFDSFSDTVTDAELAKAIIANNGANYQSNAGNVRGIDLGLGTLSGSKALTITCLEPSAKNGYVSMQFRGADYDTGNKIHYYEFDTKMPSYDNHYISVSKVPYGESAHSTRINLFRNKDVDAANSNGIHVGIVLDYNDAPTATIYFNGKERSRVDLSSLLDDGGAPVLTWWPYSTNRTIYIDNFEYSVYDVVAAPTFGGTSIAGGKDNPILETLSEISFTGTDYLDGQNAADFVTLTERDNDSDGEFTASSIAIAPVIDGTDIIVAFPDGLVMGKTYKINISGLQDSYLNYYNDYEFTFRTLNENENPLPVINLISPEGGTRFYPNESDTVELSAEATDILDGTIEYVEFYADGVLIEGSRQAVPVEGNTYTYVWVLDGSIDRTEPVAITAKAVDNEDGITETMPVNIIIRSKVAPDVTIISPTRDTVYRTNIIGVDLEVKPTIEFVAEDADGTISAITIYVDGEQDGTVAEPLAATSYTIAQDLDAGEHTILVEVYDDHGLRSEDSIRVIVEAQGKAGYLLNEKYATEDLLVKWSKLSGTVSFANGSLTEYDDIRGIVIDSGEIAGDVQGEIYRVVVNNFTDQSFATDVSVAFNDTATKRVVKLNDTELATFDNVGKITYGGAQVDGLTYQSGEIYNVSAVVDAENDKIYALVNGTIVGSASAEVTFDAVISISHEGAGETAIIAASASLIGEAVEPTVVADGNEITVTFPAGVDKATLDGNVSVVNVETGKAVDLIYADGVFTINEILKYTESYKIVVSTNVRDINGMSYSGMFEEPFAVPAPSVAVAEVSGSVEGNTATLSVDFIGAAESKVVTLVCAAYKNNKMVAYGTHEFNTNTELTDYPLTLTGTIEAGSVIEAFVVDGELNSVTDKIFVVE